MEESPASAVEGREAEKKSSTKHHPKRKQRLKLWASLLLVSFGILLYYFLSGYSLRNKTSNSGRGASLRNREEEIFLEDSITPTPSLEPSLIPSVFFDSTAIPSKKPTVEPILNQSVCCFYAAGNALCQSCGSGDHTDWCSLSARNCAKCGGRYCNMQAVSTPSNTHLQTNVPTTNPRTPMTTQSKNVHKNFFLMNENNFYINPTYTQNIENTMQHTSDPHVLAELASLKEVPSAYWIDVKAKIRAGNSTDNLYGILLDAATKPDPPLCVFMLYDVPNRDCNAYASRGEICCAYLDDGSCDYENSADCDEGLSEYKNTYVDPYVDVLEEFDGIVPIAIIVEPDSLPNFATNLDNPRCGNLGTQNAYKNGIAYAVSQIAQRTHNVSIYLDAAHGGWLGWENNLHSFLQSVKEMKVEQHLRGFATNVANYQYTGSPCPNSVDCITGDSFHSCCHDSCGLLSQWNRANNEHNYARLLVSAASAAMPGFEAHVIIDTGRNGNPDARGENCATWCNPRNALVGNWPTAHTLDPDIVDAYYWLKTPGESDGCTQILPSEDDEFVPGLECPRFDTGCAEPESIGTRPGEPYAPEAGAWFYYQMLMLAGRA